MQTLQQNSNKNKSALPICSVVIAAHNASPYILAAVNSLQSQTLQEIEIIIVDDASTDTTSEIVSGISRSDDRVHLTRLLVNQGQSFALNTGVLAARGKYVAFMDADDLAFPRRLELQINAMEKNKQLILVGGSIITMCDVTGKDGFVWRYETDTAAILVSSLFKSEFMTGTMCLRREMMLKHQLFFDPVIEIGADWELSIRAMKLGRVTNLTEILIHYRIHKAQVTANLLDNHRSSSASIRKVQLESLGIEPSIEDLMVHLAVSPCNYWAYGSHPYFIKFGKRLPYLAKEWFKRLQNANNKTGRYNPPVFSQYLQKLENLISTTNFNKPLCKGYCPVIAAEVCPAEIRCR